MEQLVKERLVNDATACSAFYHDNNLNTDNFGISKKNFDVDLKCSHNGPTSGLLSKLKQNWRAILASAVPFLAFLAVFVTNKQTHLLPTADDVNRVTLYNVTAWEERLHIASFHKSISDFNSLPLDLLAAVPYLAHYAIPLVYPIVLIAMDRVGVIPEFYRLIGFTMWFDLVIWSHFPTFPPWATDSSFSSMSPGHSASNQTLHTGISLHLRQGAAFARVDNFTGLHIFRTLFSDNPVPFASFSIWSRDLADVYSVDSAFALEFGSRGGICIRHAGGLVDNVLQPSLLSRRHRSSRQRHTRRKSLTICHENVGGVIIRR